MKQIAHPKPLSADEILADAANIIARHLPDARIFLFGSRAKGDARETSDFDIAVDAGSKISFGVIARIKDEIDELRTLKSIDIIDLNRVNPKFKEIVRKSGVNIHDRGNRTV
ncbi:MAG: nucleotidyltransferase domain-containing protein [Euryarchaeota archaeon]|nr:nucleotidyltransferase domain-containing protein [Euryarchaeota archaeon]